MDEDKLKKTESTTEQEPIIETKPPRNEGDANFDVTSLDEVKDENGNGIFHMTPRFKWILALSLLVLIAIGALSYAVFVKVFVAEIWQISLWGICAVLSVYAVVKKSVATLILNLVLMFGVSLIPIWQSAHENLLSIYKLFLQ
ncbi:MAG: hypothetical protein K6G55_06185 [Selenomonadaceae bacterium]|nr:hypothetical protein [Selenomonadaceae bacterium]